MQVRMVVVGAVRGIEELTYSVPAELEGRVRPGHRVLAPLRSRKVTGVVLETAPSFPGTNGHLKPILEVLEPRPLFDRAHLQMMEFLATYYMVPLADVYRSVIPAVARVESRLMYKLARQPDALRQAAYTDSNERLSKRSRSILSIRASSRGSAPQRALASALASLMAEGIVETRRLHPRTSSRRQRSDRASGRAIRTRSRCAERSSARCSRRSRRPAAASQPRRSKSRRAGREARAEDSRAPRHRANGGSAAAANAQVSSQRRDARRSRHRMSSPPSSAPRSMPSRAPSRRSATKRFLLYGVTGSGKTEVYLQLAARALAAGRNVIVMVPEIALADEVVRSFRARFGSLVGIAHSAQNVSRAMGELDGGARRARRAS